MSHVSLWLEEHSNQREQQEYHSFPGKPPCQQPASNLGCALFYETFIKISLSCLKPPTALEIKHTFLTRVIRSYLIPAPLQTHLPSPLAPDTVALFLVFELIS